MQVKPEHPEGLHHICIGYVPHKPNVKYGRGVWADPELAKGDASMPAAMTAAALDATLGERLSPSQVNTFLSCPAKWYFRCALGLVEPATGTLAPGTAVHSVLAASFWQKIETKQDLPAQELEESFGGAFAMAAEGAEFREDEEPAALIESALVRSYMADAAPWIEPQGVELPVEGAIGGRARSGHCGSAGHGGAHHRL